MDALFRLIGGVRPQDVDCWYSAPAVCICLELRTAGEYAAAKEDDFAKFASAINHSLEGIIMTTSHRLLPGLLLAAATVVGSPAAWAHASLQSATPARDAVVAMPNEVVLRFDEKLEAAFSNAEVVDSTGKTVSAGKSMLDPSDPSVLKVAVPALTPGKYTVRFVVVGRDGHRRKGDYSFSVK